MLGAASARAPLSAGRSIAKENTEPPPGLSASVKFAAHQRDDAPGDGEAEPGALIATRVGAVALLEILEDRRAAIGGTPGPVSMTLNNMRPSAARETLTPTPPASVNLTALPARLVSA